MRERLIVILIAARVVSRCDPFSRQQGYATCSNARVGHQPIVIDKFPDLYSNSKRISGGFVRQCVPSCHFISIFASNEGRTGQTREGARAVSRQRAYQRKATSSSTSM